MTLHSVRPVNADRQRELTNQGRLATLAETLGLIATAVRDDGELRGPLLALVVQSQLWLADLDETPGPAA